MFIVGLLQHQKVVIKLLPGSSINLKLGHLYKSPNIFSDNYPSR